jgi:2-pyrone-4,6-dicarboxylate lactonase
MSRMRSSKIIDFFHIIDFMLTANSAAVKSAGRGKSMRRTAELTDARNMTSPTPGMPPKPCPGPDRRPKRPAFVMPRGACDTHVHVFGPQATFPFSDQRSYTPEDCTCEDLMQLHATLGIDRAVIVHGGAHGTDNRATLAALRSYPTRLRGVAVIPSGLPQGEL